MTDTKPFENFTRAAKHQWPELVVDVDHHDATDAALDAAGRLQSDDGALPTIIGEASVHAMLAVADQLAEIVKQLRTANQIAANRDASLYGISPQVGAVREGLGL